MRDLPTGRVTFLFTDIEGSTRLLQELGGDYVGVLEEHRWPLRLAFAQCGGVEVDTQGDAFFVVFERATDAVAAALAAQAALASSALRVRIGVHTGEPTVTDEGYVGLDVHRAARIMSAGHGGQILVSDRVRSLAALDREPERVELAGLLGWFWLTHSHLAEGAARLEAALLGSAGGATAARALVAAGALAGQRGRSGEAETLFTRGTAAWRAAGDEAELAAALDTFGWFLFFAGENDRGVDSFEQSLELWRSLGNPSGETRALTGVCQLLVAQGEVGRAEDLSCQLLELSRRDHDLRSEHFAIHFLATCSKRVSRCRALRCPRPETATTVARPGFGVRSKRPGRNATSASRSRSGTT